MDKNGYVRKLKTALKYYMTAAQMEMFKKELMDDTVYSDKLYFAEISENNEIFERVQYYRVYLKKIIELCKTDDVLWGYMLEIIEKYEVPKKGIDELGNTKVAKGPTDREKAMKELRKKLFTTNQDMVSGLFMAHTFKKPRVFDYVPTMEEKTEYLLKEYEKYPYDALVAILSILSPLDGFCYIPPINKPPKRGLG